VGLEPTTGVRRRPSGAGVGWRYGRQESAALAPGTVTSTGPKGCPRARMPSAHQGPEFSDFDLDDLNPRRFVQKHLLSGLNRDDPDGTEASGKTPATASQALP
jgi:hypothetical protein